MTIGELHREVNVTIGELHREVNVTYNSLIENNKQTLKKNPVKSTLKGSRVCL